MDVLKSSPSSLPYREPSIRTLLALAALLLGLNAVNWLLDRAVFCGLVGQILVGVLLGTPLAGEEVLAGSLQQAVVQWGYVGLVGVVYEGGISSNFPALRANLLLSSAVALTGIAVPIGLTFALLPALIPGVSAVQAFAAGAALCSTSLGTTFTVLATSGLTESRLGVVLSSAAMMDDVVGLVMVQLISQLRGDDFSAVTVARPVAVSIAFAVLVPVICRFVAKPVVDRARSCLEGPGMVKYRRVLCCSKAAFVYQTGVLLAMITAASYAGTSSLFAAYLAGASVTWISDNLDPSGRQEAELAAEDRTASMRSSAVNHAPTSVARADEACSGKAVYEKFYMPVIDHVLRPFFFASIGFAIPVTRLFHGATTWRGVVYSTLMALAKVVCGAWLLRFGSSDSKQHKVTRIKQSTHPVETNLETSIKELPDQDTEPPTEAEAPVNISTMQHIQDRPDTTRRVVSDVSRKLSSLGASQSQKNDESNGQPHRPAANTPRKRTSVPIDKPRSLYPATILGMAMVSRGEIGFLISSVAETGRVFGEPGNNTAFLVVTWAILLCTLIGPISVGLLVKRVRKLQDSKQKMTTAGIRNEDPLGTWGVVSPEERGLVN